MMRRHRAALLAVLLLGACSRAPAGTLAPERAVSDRLFFGRNVPGGGTVSDSAWAVFLAEVVTPRFPDGFTVFRTEGQWRGNNGAIEREAGFVFEVHHPPGSPPDSVFVAISNEYIRRFRQEAVFRARSAADAWLYRAPQR
jgi:hypothetical protein